MNIIYLIKNVLFFKEDSNGNYTYAVQVCSPEKKDKCNTENILKVTRVVDGDTIKLEKDIPETDKYSRTPS